MLRTAIITLSDKGSRGERVDESGQVIREMIASAGGTVGHYEVLPDEETRIAETLARLADSGLFDLIVFNPPYLPTQPEERIDDWLEYALDGGVDGRAVITRFAPSPASACAHPRPSPLLAAQTSAHLPRSPKSMFPSSRFSAPRAPAARCPSAPVPCRPPASR